MVGEHDYPSGMGSSNRRAIADFETPISDLGPIFDLLSKPAMADLYLKLLDGGVTVPQLLDDVELTKSTVYQYVKDLQSAGLLEEAGEEDGATAYDAHEFTMTLEIDASRVEVTPELVQVLSHRDSEPIIETFVEQHGVAKLVEFIDLAYDQARGDVTTRMIAEVLNVSRGTAFDMVETIHRILDVGDEPESHTADELSDRARDRLLE